MTQPVPPSRPPALHAPGLDGDRARRLAAACGLALEPWQPPVRAGEGRAVILLAGPSAPDVTADAVWEPPHAAWIEVADLADRLLERAITQAMAFDLFASFTTASVNDLHLAGRLVGAATARRALPSGMCDDMELALHEAISNAVVHGNLQVEGMKGLSMESLDRFSADLAERMLDPAFAGRRVEVSARFGDDGLTFEVADEGNGFTWNRRDGIDASGRGLELITAIVAEATLLEGGRRIRMRFAL